MTIDPRHGLVVSIPPPQRRGWAGGAVEARVEGFVHERERWVIRHLGNLARDRAAQQARGGIVDGGTVRYRGEPHRIRVVGAGPTARRSAVERSGSDSGDELVLRLAARDRRTPEAVLDAWLRLRAREVIDRAVARESKALGVTPARVDLRDPRTRWGSASKEGRLMFSWRLVLAPPDALETVVVHELAHLKVFGHGPRFWALVASRRPSHLADRAWLRRHSHELHAALEPVAD
jgi:predicted metal-dependent hydrolase